MIRRRAAAAADDVDEAVACELSEHPARVVRLLVIRAELIREACIRIARDPRRRELREILDERAHIGRAKGAVHADDERLGVLDGHPERLGGLAGEVAAALVDRGEREPERNLRRRVEGSGDRGLCIQ